MTKMRKITSQAFFGLNEKDIKYAAKFLTKNDPEGGERYWLDLDIYCWPEMFASTSGPHGGIAGNQLTKFTVWAFVDQFGLSAIECEGTWKFIKKDFKPCMKVNW